MSIYQYAEREAGSIWYGLFCLPFCLNNSVRFCSLTVYTSHYAVRSAFLVLATLLFVASSRHAFHLKIKQLTAETRNGIIFIGNTTL